MQTDPVAPISGSVRCAFPGKLFTAYFKLKRVGFESIKRIRTVH